MNFNIALFEICSSGRFALNPIFPVGERSADDYYIISYLVNHFSFMSLISNAKFGYDGPASKVPIAEDLLWILLLLNVLMFLSMRSCILAGTSISSQSYPLSCPVLAGSTLYAKWKRLSYLILKSIGLKRNEVVATCIARLLLPSL